MKFELAQFNYLEVFGFITSDKSTYIRYRYDTFKPLMLFNRNTVINCSKIEFAMNFYLL